jgi:glutamate-1-semialdehyde 2,1-aminomutase
MLGALSVTVDAVDTLVRKDPLHARAHQVIPGGSHTYAKGDDQYPANAPAFIERGSGCHVWSTDGREFIEYGMGLRAVTLGHAHPTVNRAAAAQMEKGLNFGRPSLIEVECAERLLELIEGADMAKFTKDGSTANTAAVKLARAYTGRSVVGVCGDHPFFSYDDWAMQLTDVDAGIPEEGRHLTTTFRYNDIASVETLFRINPGAVACLIMEPAKAEHPTAGFLHRVKELCHANGALLIFDEMITGFRWHESGAQRYYDIVPDLSTFGKALGNGFAISALVGRREVMALGGLDHDRERVFLLSTTHGAEAHAMAAAIEVMRLYREEGVIERLHAGGQRLKDGFDQAIVAEDCVGHVAAIGLPWCLVYATRDPEGRPSQAYRTLFMQEMIRRGVIGPSLIISASHSDEDIDRTVEALAGAMSVYRRALDDGTEGLLEGPPTKSVYRRFN